MRTSVLAAGGVALALALSACGGDSDSNSADGGSGGNANNAQFSDISQLVASAQEQASVSKSSKFSMEMDMAGMKMQANGEGVYDGADTRMRMTMNMQGMDIDMIFVDQTMYMQMPENMNPDPSKPWIKVTEDASAAMGQNFDQMTEQNDPTKMLEQIEQAGGKITNTEQTQLDGQDVTHYTIEMDLSKASGMMGGDAGAAASFPEGTMIPMELYLTGDNLPVQIVMDMSSLSEQFGGTGNMKMVMKYSDWGTPVEVEAPPAEQVGEMPTN
ncbi:hypothetical protein [Saccharomonospora piscinae]|uniref:hypothetical protein n=1 Tax=Saccharomonospora piscinae TaxID=687388 RepID=UPI000466F97D|nr:hypothetical protein [Saccharomonospora piscinae]